MANFENAVVAETAADEEREERKKKIEAAVARAMREYREVFKRLAEYDQS